MTQPSTEPTRTDVWKMFDRISRTYDLMNRVMTGCLDIVWRKKMAEFLPSFNSIRLLDCATGTADQLIALVKKCPQIDTAIGIDLAAEMLQIGRKKAARLPYADKISFQVASALEIPFPEDFFECVTMSFGIRNVTNVTKCLSEILRVLKPSGRVLILEGSMPEKQPLRTLHLWYLRYILPRLGRWIARQKEAYDYLNRTIETFPSGEGFCAYLRQAGFTSVKAHPLFGGIVTIYQGDKS